MLKIGMYMVGKGTAHPAQRCLCNRKEKTIYIVYINDSAVDFIRN